MMWPLVWLTILTFWSSRNFRKRLNSQPLLHATWSTAICDSCHLFLSVEAIFPQNCLALVLLTLLPSLLVYCEQKNPSSRLLLFLQVPLITYPISSSPGPYCYTLLLLLHHYKNYLHLWYTFFYFTLGSHYATLWLIILWMVCSKWFAQSLTHSLSFHPLPTT